MENTTDDKLQTDSSPVDTDNKVASESSANVSASQTPADTSTGSDANDVPQTSSPAETDANKKRSTLLDVVKNVANKGKTDVASSATESKEDTSKDSNTGEKAVKDDASSGQKTEEKLPFHNHPRWKQLVQERETFKSRSDEYGKIETYMTVNKLSPQEVAQGYHVMSLIKNNPAEAYRVLQGHLQRLAPIVGETLPEDIEKKVEMGDVDVESAKELARARAHSNFLIAQQHQAAAEQQAQDFNAKQASARDAVMGWEENMKRRDPDYSAKQKFVMDRVRNLLQTVQPQSAEEALAIVDKAYQEVTVDMSAFIPKRSSTVLTSSASSVSAQPQPKTLLDVVRFAAARQ
jgi:hypothetical protein